MSKNKFYLIVLLPLLLLFTACPYSSSFKVGNPILVDASQWEGHWVSTKIEAGNKIKDELVFKKKGTNALAVQTEFHVLRSDRPSMLKLKGYPVSIGGKNWLLLYNSKDNKKKEYMYLQYEFKSVDKLELKVLSDEKVPENISSAAELEKWLTENQSNAEVWEDAILFERSNPLLQSK